MRRFLASGVVVLLTAFAPSAHGDVGAVAPLLDVLGIVTNAARPVGNALVIALNLKDLGAIQTYSAADGSFSLPHLPSGIYKVIAVKQGFAPAMATVLPNQPSHKVALVLQSETQNARKREDQMWQIRASLPADILREVEQVLAPQTAAAAATSDYALPRLKGEMMSMTGVADQAANAAFARTSLGVESRLGDTWQLGLHGNLHRIDDPTADSTQDPAAESSVMSMELRSSPTDAYRLASTRSSWRYAATPDDRSAGVRSHELEWDHGTARFAVRYLAQENVFAAAPAGSDLIELTGGTTLLQTGRSDIGVSLRVMQESMRNSTAAPIRTADLTTTASLAIVPAFTVRYGLSGRMAVDGTELAPRAGVEWKMSPDARFVADGMYKVVDPYRESGFLPAVGSSAEDGRLLPKYAMSFGIVSGDENSSHLSAIASVTAFESPLRVIFTDGSEQFWDGFYIDSGDVQREIRVSCRKDLAKRIGFDVSATAGTATPSQNIGEIKSYVQGDVQSVIFATGTTILFSYREQRQPQPQGVEYKSERASLRMAQSLHLPLDLKILLGIEIAHAENSPFLLDSVDDTTTGSTRRYVAGLAVSF